MSGSNENYSMSIGRRRNSSSAFAPSQMELLTQQQIGQMDGGQLLGYHLRARTNAQNMQDAASAAAAQAAAADVQEAELRAAAQIASSDNPWMLPLLGAGRRQIAPEAASFADTLPPIGRAGEIARASYDAARANQANVEAGVMPPQGTEFDQYSMPLAPRRQGVPLDERTAAMRAASGAGGPRLSDFLAAERVAQAVMAEVPRATQNLLRSSLTSAGFQAQLDASGNVIRPQGIDDARFNALVDQARRRAEADAAARLQGMQGRLGQRFGVDFTAGLPVVPEGQMPSAPAPAAPQPAARPAVTETPTTGRVRPADTVPTANRASPNAVSPAEAQRINAIAPPERGMMRVMVGDVVQYRNAAGQVVREVPIR